MLLRLLCSEIVQAKISDLQNPTTVNNAVGRFEISMKFNLAAVKKPHALDKKRFQCMFLIDHSKKDECILVACTCRHLLGYDQLRWLDRYVDFNAWWMTLEYIFPQHFNFVLTLTKSLTRDTINILSNLMSSFSNIS